MLTETMAAHIPDQLFSGEYSVATIPPDRPGTAGQGHLLAVRYSTAYSIHDHTSDSSTLSVRVHPTDNSQPLVLGVSYIPPAGSVQLTNISLQERLDELSAAVLSEPGAPALIGGDFNAHISPANSHGRALLEACQAASLQVCTGQIPGDQPAQPSLRPTARTQPTRPDHFLANEQAFPLLVSAHVNQQQRGSDHLPLEARLQLPWQPQSAMVESSGTPVTRHVWQPAARADYVSALQSHPSLGLSMDAAQHGDPLAGLEQLYAAISSAATASGMPARPSQRSAGSGRYHQPFIDQECLQLKRAVRAASADQSKQLERAYHALVRRKARAYKEGQLRKLLAGACLQQRSFWQALRRPGSKFQAALQTVQAWDGFMQQTANVQHPAGLYLPAVAYPSHPSEPAAVLNAPISISEVHAALSQLHNGRAHGPAGLPAELLRYAQPASQPGQAGQPQPHVLAPALAAVLDSMFQAGHVPAEFNLSLVTPVFKRGDLRSTANYRAITVAEPVMRLYAAMLNQRLLQYTEQHSLRAPSQAGFRPKLSVVHQLFSLQHISERQKQRRQQLYVCFLDLKGAFDRVPRQLLWQSLQQLGLHGHMLAAVQSLYSTASIAVKIQGQQGPAIQSETGVKQGCPLSPTLFGLLADGLHRALQSTAAQYGVQLSPGLSVTDLGYADDFALLSSTADGLQVLITVAATWCSAVGMQPSPDKTVVMELTRAEQPQYVWQCGGAQLRTVTQARYLGMLFQAGHSFQPTFTSLEQRMWASHYFLRKQYKGLGCSDSVWLPLQLHAACVEPAGSFASELWGVYQQHSVSRQRLETARLRQIRQLAGLSQSVALPIIWRELSLQPYSHAWLVRAARFWNNLAVSQGFHKHLALDAVRLAVQSRVRNWVHGLHRALLSVGYHMQLATGVMHEIDIGDLRSCLAAQLASAWESVAVNPRSCPSQGARLCTYLQWFACPDSCPKRLLRLPLPRKAMVCLLRLRTGCHGLPNIAGSWVGVPRSQRLCPLCEGQYADERHALLECPALAGLRQQYAQLFSGHLCMRQFMWQEDMVMLVQYVIQCLRAFQPVQL